MFLVSSVVLSAVLAIVMFIAWNKLLDTERVRLDTRLCSEAKRLAVRQFAQEEWQRLESDVRDKLRLTEPQDMLMALQGSSPGDGYQSSDWGKWGDVDRLAWQGDPDAARPRPGKREAPRRARCELAFFDWQGAGWRIARHTERDSAGMVAANLRASNTEVRKSLLNTLGILVPTALGLAALAAWLLSAMMLRPMNRLRDAMKMVAPTALDQRLKTNGEDREFVALIDTYNTMLERLEASFLQASRFSADAAHELKTPLTILRGRLEQALRRANDSEDARWHEEFSVMMDEVGRLSAITRKLLLLSQADAGKLELSRSAVDLSSMLHEMVADLPVMANGRSIKSNISANLVIHGDAMLLRQLFNNLLGNAVRHGIPDGFIHLSAQQVGKMVEVEVANASQSIAPDVRSRFFERFYRGSTDRNRRSKGSGLGLSIAMEIAKVHGGTLELQPSTVNEVRLRVRLASATPPTPS